MAPPKVQIQNSEAAQLACTEISLGNLAYTASPRSLKGLEFTEEQKEFLLTTACKRGYLSLLKQLEAKYTLAFLNDPLPESQSTALEQAVWGGQREIITYLLHRGVVPTANTAGQYPLYTALELGNISLASFLFKAQQAAWQKKKMSSKEPIIPYLYVDSAATSPMILAIKLKNIMGFIHFYFNIPWSKEKRFEALDTLIEEFNKHEISFSFLKQCVEACFKYGDKESLAYLKAKGMINLKNLSIKGKNAIVLAIFYEQADLLAWLHEEHKLSLQEIRRPNKPSTSATHLAIEMGSLPIINWLRQEGFINSDDVDFIIETARNKKHWHLIIWLLQYFPFLKDTQNFNENLIEPALIALFHGEQAPFLCLVKLIPQQLGTEYVNTARIYNYLKIAGSPLPLFDEFRYHPSITTMALYIAASTGQLDMVKFILDTLSSLKNFSDSLLSFITKCAASSESIELLEYLYKKQVMNKEDMASEFASCGYLQAFKWIILKDLGKRNYILPPCKYSNPSSLIIMPALYYGHGHIVRWILQEKKLRSILPENVLKNTVNHYLELYSHNFVENNSRSGSIENLEWLISYTQKNIFELLEPNFSLITDSSEDRKSARKYLSEIFLNDRLEILEWLIEKHGFTFDISRKILWDDMFTLPDIIRQDEEILFKMYDVKIRYHSYDQTLMFKYYEVTPFGYIICKKPGKILSWLMHHPEKNHINADGFETIFSFCRRNIKEFLNQRLEQSFIETICTLLPTIIVLGAKQNIFPSADDIRVLNNLPKTIRIIFNKNYESAVNREINNKHLLNQLLAFYLKLNFESAADFVWRHQAFPILADFVFDFTRTWLTTAEEILAYTLMIKLLNKGHYALKEKHSPLNELTTKDRRLKTKLQAFYLCYRLEVKFLNKPNNKRFSTHLIQTKTSIINFLNKNCGIKADIYYLKYFIFKIFCMELELEIAWTHDESYDVFYKAFLSPLVFYISHFFESTQHPEAAKKLSVSAFRKDYFLQQQEVILSEETIEITDKEIHTLSLKLSHIGDLAAPLKYFKIYKEKGEETALNWLNKKYTNSKENFLTQYKLLIDNLTSHKDFSLALRAYLAIIPEDALNYCMMLKKHELIQSWCLEKMKKDSNHQQLAIKKYIELLSLGACSLNEYLSPLNHLDGDLESLKQAIQGLYLLDKLPDLNEEEQIYFSQRRAHFNHILANTVSLSANSSDPWHPYAHLLMVKYQLYKLGTIPQLYTASHILKRLQTMFEGIVYKIETQPQALKPGLNQPESGSSSTLPFVSKIGSTNPANTSSPAQYVPSTNLAP